jgi:hypothetical protein
MMPLRPALLTFLMTVALGAQSPRLQLQGLDRLAASASEVVDITLDGSTLKMALRFIGDDQQLRQAVSGLQGVYVKSFEFDKPGCYRKSDTDAVRAQLQGPGWSRLVGVTSRKGEDTGIWVQADPATSGFRRLVVLSAEPRELVVVELVGTVDLDKLGALQGRLGIPKVTEDRAHARGGDHGEKK